MEELFNGQLSFADIEAEKFLQIRRTHADRRVNAMDRLTDENSYLRERCANIVDSVRSLA